MKKITNTIERTQYIDKCPICKKEIKGFSESQVKYNLEVHIKQKHKEVSTGRVFNSKSKILP